MHEYAEDHFPEWFPNLPSYAGYVRRLNRLSAVFAPLTQAAVAEIGSEEVVETLRIADSFPAGMAKEKRSTQAKVAPEIADKGYCSSKDTFYYGVKLHVVAQQRPGTMPILSRVGLSAGSENDLTTLRQVLPFLQDGQLYGDKAYVDSSLRERLSEEQSLELLTPPKKSKGQERLSAAEKLFSEAAGRARQPIESLFNWIEEKTGIQEASKVRSSEGLMVHAFGRLAAAMLLLALNP
nr:IS982 family transposase [Salinibacter ruber]